MEDILQKQYSNTETQQKNIYIDTENAYHNLFF